MIRLFWILLAAALCGCEKKQADIMRPVNKPDTTDNNWANRTYLALGDSYTIGESVPLATNFPNQLVYLLNGIGYHIADPVIIARTGWTTDELMKAIEQRALTEKFDIVTLLIGVNNQYRQYNIDTYRTEFVALLDTAIKYADGNKKHVFVLSIPDYSVTPFGNGPNKEKIAREVALYNAINKQESEIAGVNYTDITPISQGATADPDLVARDGLHPSAKMYDQWVRLLAPQVQEQVEK